MILNCVIIDDEPLAAQQLQSYVEKIPILHLTGVYNSAITAMKDLREGNIQLLFLDIQVPELSGIEFAKVIKNDTKIIFTTAFPQYAINSFRVSALDYLLKPISYEDFLTSVFKAQDFFMQKYNEEERFFYVKSDYKLQRINLDNILYIEGQKDYVRIYLENGDKIMSLMNMKALEEYLPHPEFIRTHRSYIVHMNKIDSVVRFHIMINNQSIPISDSYKDAIQRYFDNHTVG